MGKIGSCIIYLKKTFNYLNKSENEKNNLILVLFFISRVIIEEGINTNFENLFLDSKKYSKKTN